MACNGRTRYRCLALLMLIGINSNGMAGEVSRTNNQGYRLSLSTESPKAVLVDRGGKTYSDFIILDRNPSGDTGADNDDLKTEDLLDLVEASRNPFAFQVYDQGDRKIAVFGPYGLRGGTIGDTSERGQEIAKSVAWVVTGGAVVAFSAATGGLGPLLLGAAAGGGMIGGGVQSGVYELTTPDAQYDPEEPKRKFKKGAITGVVAGPIAPAGGLAFGAGGAAMANGAAGMLTNTVQKKLDGEDVTVKGTLKAGVAAMAGGAAAAGVGSFAGWLGDQADNLATAFMANVGKGFLRGVAGGGAYAASESLLEGKKPKLNKTGVAMLAGGLVGGIAGGFQGAAEHNRAKQFATQRAESDRAYANGLREGINPDIDAIRHDVKVLLAKGFQPSDPALVGNAEAIVEQLTQGYNRIAFHQNGRHTRYINTPEGLPQRIQGLATLEANIADSQNPVVQPPQDPSVLESWFAGQAAFAGRAMSQADARQALEDRDRDNGIGALMEALRAYPPVQLEVRAYYDATQQAGNCFFDNVAFQLLANLGFAEARYTSADLRARAVAYLRDNRERFEGFFAGANVQHIYQGGQREHRMIASIDRYMEAMAEEGTWADEPTILALAEALDICIVVFKRDHPTLIYHGDARRGAVFLVNWNDHFVSAFDFIPEQGFAGPA